MFNDPIVLFGITILWGICESGLIIILVQMEAGELRSSERINDKIKTAMRDSKVL